ncbi:MAG TPA: S8 family serine peptidase, partial [Baekduia sp.]
GATVVNASKRGQTVRADVPLAAIATIAGWTDVEHVGQAVQATTAVERPPGAQTPGSDPKHPPLAEALPNALAAPAAGLDSLTGAFVSEADVTEAVAAARASTGINGAGVKVCAMSDGIDSLAGSQAAGELPPDVDVLPGQGGSGDEGTAMLELIHDLAPKATLGYATAFDGDASFADNIIALREQAHCDVIVDDVSYYDEVAFQDGPVAQAVNRVTAEGALYFSSAGNDGNVLDGTSGSYDGTFADAGTDPATHDFDPGAGTQTADPVDPDSTLVLSWADPLGHAADDYDLYELDDGGHVVGFSQDVQDGDDDPVEIVQDIVGEGTSLEVVKSAGAPRQFQLSAPGGRFRSRNGLTAYATPGTIVGHRAAADALTVAAAPAKDPLGFDLEPGDPPNPTGPFPGTFTGAEAPERFTSDGPSHLLFAPDGTPLPGPDGVVRQKPDFTAADGVSTSVAGFQPFFGTSAAAPHAAAIAALVLSGNPDLRTGDASATATMRAAFAGTALDLAPAGVDSRTGAGVIRADLVLAATGGTPQPALASRALDVTSLTDDGDGYLEPGESATVAVPIANIGDGTAPGVTVTLDGANPRAAVTALPAYGDIPADGSASRDVQVTLAPNYPLGRPVVLDQTLTYAGAAAPVHATVVVPTGAPAGPGSPPESFAYTGPAVPIPDGSPTGASVTIPVAGAGPTHDVTFSIDGTTCSTSTGATTVGLDHSYVEDLTATLTAPDGRTATLFKNAGDGGKNLCQVVFDDSATTPFAVSTAADAPYAGTWSPADPLSSLLTDPVNGDWTFHVVDGALSDHGTIRAVSLHFYGFLNEDHAPPTLDVTPAAAPGVTGPVDVDGTPYFGGDVSVTLHAADGGRGLAGTACRIDGEATPSQSFTPAEPGAATDAPAFDVSGEGPHAFSCTSTDVAGNVSAPSAGAFTIHEAPPDATVTAPADGGTYAQDAVVATAFACAESAGGPGMGSCIDGVGAVSPGVLDTGSPGPHTYTVTARSRDGLSRTASIDYTVTAPTEPPGDDSADGGGTPDGGGATPDGGGGGGTGIAPIDGGSLGGMPPAPVLLPPARPSEPPTPCAGSLVLVSAAPRDGARRVGFVGVADPARAGQILRIVAQGHGVARARVTRAGTFAAVAPAPAPAARTTVRYRAVLGARTSASVPLVRAVTLRAHAAAAGRTQLDGTALSGRTLHVEIQLACSRLSTVLRSVHPAGAGGRFAFTIPAPRGLSIVRVRAADRVGFTASVVLPGRGTSAR